MASEDDELREMAKILQNSSVEEIEDHMREARQFVNSAGLHLTEVGSEVVVPAMVESLRVTRGLDPMTAVFVLVTTAADVGTTAGFSKTEIVGLMDACVQYERHARGLSK